MLNIALLVAAALLLALAGLWLFGERGHLLLPSTRTFLKLSGGWRSIRDGHFVTSYIYSRWSDQYIGWSIKYLFPRMKPDPHDTRWADIYHGKVMTIEQAQNLVSLEVDVPLQDLDQVIPFSTARNIVLNGPPDVAIYECPCRSARENPCMPTDVCMIVGQPFVDFIVEHNPRTARRINQQEALDILQAEHERGHVHTAYFRQKMFDRFYAICNCCGCCCGGIEAMRDLGVPKVISSGYVAEVDWELCTHCGLCEVLCQFDAISYELPSCNTLIAWDACLGCGVCEGNCPYGAITITLDERKGLPLEVEKLVMA